MRFAWECVCLVALASLTSCEAGQVIPAAPSSAPAPSSVQSALDARLRETRQELDREFVVFAAPALAIQHLETPMPPPVTPGSRPGPGTMRSDDPGVVSVEPDGTLVAHREGRTRVRAAGSSSVLDVVVRPRMSIAGSTRKPVKTGEWNLR